jgi:Domain of unknown function (DUF4136)
MSRWRVMAKSAALAATLAAGTLLAQGVHVDFDNSANFGQYKTFCFIQVHSSDQTAETRLKEAITKNLTDKGWHVADSDCQVSIAAIGGVKDRKEYSTFYEGLAPGWGWRSGLRGWGDWGSGGVIIRVDDIPVGLLVVDLFDTSSKQLVWRGTSKNYLSGNSDKNADKLHQAVDKMFNKFPPK